MKLNLYDILSVKGKRESYEAEFKKQQISFQGEQLTVEGKELFQINLYHEDKKLVHVNIDLIVIVTRLCSRCLEDVTREYAVSIERIINVAKNEAFTDKYDEFDEVSYIEDCTLDVDMLILDELYTILPMSIFCKEDCKGICKVCGTNLNKSTCDCDQNVPDPRMAVFSDIFNQFKEV